MNDRQERLSAVQKMVTSSVQDLSGAVIEIEEPLQEAGVDSLGATELHQQVQDKVGGALILPSTLLFDYPTVSAMSEHIVNELDGVQSVSVTQVKAQADAYQPGITGVACYAPGGCRSSAELRDLLGSGRDTIQCVPWSRLEMSSAPPVEEVYVTHGYYMENVELFDHTSFKMGSAEARTTDPHQRLLLEVGCDALVKSGRDRGMMTRSDVGVYIGFTAVNEWNAVLAAKPDTIRVGAFYLGADSAAAAGRLSYVLGLKGPSLVVNTACSSSLVATDVAVQHLRSQRCPSALIAGVNLQLHAGGLVALCAAHAVAADGQCKTFDSSADGYGRGEACGAIMVEDVHTDDVKGVGQTLASIMSTAVNQDGRSASFMAPNGPSQEALLRLAMAEAGLNSEHKQELGLVESHGTGTGLGDPMEVFALGKAFENEPAVANTLVLGALKSSVGHTEGSAGVMGMIKAITGLLEFVVTPNLHLQQLNPKLQLQSFSVVMPGVAGGDQALRSGGLSVAGGVSSFGATGTNAHAVFDQCSFSEDGTKSDPVKPVSFDRTKFPWWEEATSLSHSRLGNVVFQNNTQIVWQQHWNRSVVELLSSHRIGKAPVVPGWVYMDMARTVANFALPEESEGQKAETKLTKIIFIEPLHLDCLHPPLYRPGGARVVRRSYVNITVNVSSLQVKDDEDWIGS